MRFVTNNEIDFPEFMMVCAILMLTQKLCDIYDPQRLGQITIDSSSIACLGMWFI